MDEFLKKLEDTSAGGLGSVRACSGGFASLKSLTLDGKVNDPQANVSYYVKVRYANRELRRRYLAIAEDHNRKAGTDLKWPL